MCGIQADQIINAEQKDDGDPFEKRKDENIHVNNKTWKEKINNRVEKKIKIKR